MKHLYQVKGMHCTSCIAKVKDALRGFTASIEVTLLPPRAILETQSLPDLGELNAALASAGSYMLLPLDTESFETIESKDPQKSWIATYYPLALIVGMIAIVSCAGAATFRAWMHHFMAAFFLVFGAFKLLDLPGFQAAYATYDLLAKQWKNYGYIYPFLELTLGFAFLFQIGLKPALWFSFLLMGFSSLGVLKAVKEKRKIRCACLGTALNLPMSTITLIEDLGMALMAIAMLVLA